MSVSAISSQNSSNNYGSTVKNQIQQLSQEFQQLGQDLKSGNLAGAQQDYAQLQSNSPHRAIHGHHHHYFGANGETSLSQLLNELGQSLQAGKLAAAQQEYSALQQQFQQFAVSAGGVSTSNSNDVSVSA